MSEHFDDEDAGTSENVDYMFDLGSFRLVHVDLFVQSVLILRHSLPP